MSICLSVGNKEQQMEGKRKALEKVKQVYKKAKPFGRNDDKEK